MYYMIYYSGVDRYALGPISKGGRLSVQKSFFRLLLYGGCLAADLWFPEMKKENHTVTPPTYCNGPQNQ